MTESTSTARPIRDEFRRVLDQLRGLTDGVGVLCIECKEDIYAHGAPRHDDIDRCQRCGTARARERRIVKALLDVPEEFRGKGFDKYQVPPGSREALEVASNWTRAHGYGLLLWSTECGTGKSHLAFALAQAAIMEGALVEAHSMGALLASMKATFSGRRGPTLEDILDRMERADVVVLDDLGVEKVTDWVREQLYEIVDIRHRRRRPLIVTSNFGPTELASRIGDIAGDRIVSRLVAMSRVVEVQGDDYRMRVAMSRARAP